MFKRIALLILLVLTAAFFAAPVSSQTSAFINVSQDETGGALLFDFGAFEAAEGAIYQEGLGARLHFLSFTLHLNREDGSDISYTRWRYDFTNRLERIREYSTPSDHLVIRVSSESFSGLDILEWSGKLVELEVEFTDETGNNITTYVGFSIRENTLRYFARDFFDFLPNVSVTLDDVTDPGISQEEGMPISEEFDISYTFIE